MSLFAPPVWDENALSRWLDQQCRREDIRQEDLLEFCRRTTAALSKAAGYGLDFLARAKYALAAAMRAKLDRLRKTTLWDGHQQLLFGPGRKVEISFDDPYRFPASGYAENVQRYRGPCKFQKHYYPDVRVMNTEESDCAMLLDARPEVASWIRNVEKQDGSFKLPLHDGWFYPDFVARLKDGRTLAVEYKGAHLATADKAKEENNIGQLWAGQSKGKNLFLMAVARDGHGRGVGEQLSAIMSPTIA